MSGYIRRGKDLYDPSSGALVGYVDLNGAEQSLVSGAGNRFSGTRSAPISTFNGASSSGVVGTPVQLKISAGSIVYGQSLTELSFVLRKVGTSTGTIDVRFGTTQSTADTVVSPSTGNGFTATDPQEFEFRLSLSYSAGKVYGRWTRYLATGGFVTDGTETTIAFDPAVDNYLSIVLSGFSAGTTVALLAARFQHFQ